MVTSNHEKKRYKLDGLVNGAKGYIDSIQPSLEDPDVAEVVVLLGAAIPKDSDQSDIYPDLLHKCCTLLGLHALIC